MKKYIVEVYENGDVYWYNEAEEHHREDGPAVEYGRGGREWWINGELHREDGPAVDNVNDGYRAWYKHGKLHREDGPAAERADRYRKWYLDGVKLTEEEFNNRNTVVKG